jgi:hypothetical protein
VCYEVPSTESKKSLKWIQHLETKQSCLKHKLVEFFQQKLKALNDQQTSVFKVTQVNKSTLDWSFLQIVWKLQNVQTEYYCRKSNTAYCNRYDGWKL